MNPDTVVLVHGVHTSKKEASYWMGFLSSYLTLKTGLQVVIYPYGWTSGVSIGLPGTGYLARKVKRRRFQRFIAGIARTDPLARIHVIGHSFGAWLARHALISGPVRLRPRYGTFVMMGSVVECNDRFTEDRVGRVVNLYSVCDSVVQHVPGFGEAGFRGLTYARDERLGPPFGSLINVDMRPFRHRDYTLFEEPNKAWATAARWLMTS